MKITVNGEALDLGWDISRVRMSDALAIERLAGRRYVEWEADLVGGSAEATAVLVCLAWQRDGRDVPLEGILSGEVDVDFSEAFRSVMRGIGQQAAEAAAAERPTSGTVPLTVPDGTGTTPSSTKGSSPSSSA